MRANGLAVTSDYTPHWANTGNNHAWNAIVTPGGKVIPFMGAEANPGEYKLSHKAAKVYRKMFAKQPDNLVFQKKKQEKIPRWLGGKTYKDVTSDYVPVTDVTITFDKEIPDSVDIAYLCVFNSGEWRAIEWGRVKNNSAVFSDMGTGVAYVPALYLNEEIVPYGEPFILLDDKSKQSLKYDERQLTSRTITAVSDGIGDKPIENGLEYELFYWSDGWQSLQKITADDNLSLYYKNIPEGCLCWIDADNLHGEGRIFVIEKSEVVWW